MNAIYLILIVTVGNGVDVTKIPQTNLKQCQANVKNLSGKYKTLDGQFHSHSVRAHCVVGAK